MKAKLLLLCLPHCSSQVPRSFLFPGARTEMHCKDSLQLSLKICDPLAFPDASQPPLCRPYPSSAESRAASTHRAARPSPPDPLLEPPSPTLIMSPQQPQAGFIHAAHVPIVVPFISPQFPREQSGINRFHGVGFMVGKGSCQGASGGIKPPGPWRQEGKKEEPRFHNVPTT